MVKLSGEVCTYKDGQITINLDPECENYIIKDGQVCFVEGNFKTTEEVYGKNS